MMTVRKEVWLLAVGDGNESNSAGMDSAVDELELNDDVDSAVNSEHDDDREFEDNAEELELDVDDQDQEMVTTEQVTGSGSQESNYMSHDIFHEVLEVIRKYKGVIYKRPKCCCMCGKDCYTDGSITLEQLQYLGFLPNSDVEFKYSDYIYGVDDNTESWRRVTICSNCERYRQPGENKGIKKTTPETHPEHPTGVKYMMYSLLNTNLRFRTREEQGLFADLTLVEESVISILSVLIIIKRLGVKCNQRGGGQTKSSGNCCFFLNTHTVVEVVKKLPRSLRECAILFKRGDEEAVPVGAKSAAKMFKVRVSKIRECLRWLIAHNKLYEYITIDEEAMRELSQAEQVQEHVRQNESGVEGIMMHVGTDMEKDAVVDRHNNSLNAELNEPIEITRASQFVRYYQDPLFLAKCFPSLYPKGEGGNFGTFPIKLTMTQYLNHCMRFHDHRFLDNYRFIFVCVNLKDTEKGYKSIRPMVNGVVDGGGVTRNMNNAELDEKLRSAKIDVKTMVNNADQNLVNIYKSMRGTVDFWNVQKNKIINLMKFKRRPPELFMTFSSADMKWVDMVTAMSPYVLS